MKSIQSEWEAFEKAVISERASDVQHQAMKEAFWAGAVSMFSLVSDVDSMSTEEGKKYLIALNEEIHNYYHSVKAQIKR